MSKPEIILRAALKYSYPESDIAEILASSLEVDGRQIKWHMTMFRHLEGTKFLGKLIDFKAISKSSTAKDIYSYTVSKLDKIGFNLLLYQIDKFIVSSYNKKFPKNTITEATELVDNIESAATLRKT